MQRHHTPRQHEPRRHHNSHDATATCQTVVRRLRTSGLWRLSGWLRPVGVQWLLSSTATGGGDPSKTRLMRGATDGTAAGRRCESG